MGRLTPMLAYEMTNSASDDEPSLAEYYELV
jgi:hypothetical protein